MLNKCQDKANKKDEGTYKKIATQIVFQIEQKKKKKKNKTQILTK